MSNTNKKMCALIELIESDKSITEVVTKFGGQPVWIEEPQWPISKSTGKPMQFICQIVLDEKLFPNMMGNVAYIFMTDDSDGGLSITWEYEAGDNAVIIQKGDIPSFISVSNKNENHTIEKEYMVTYTYHDDLPFVSSDDALELSDDEYHNYLSSLKYTKIGGEPSFLQGDEFPEGDGCWKLLCQLEESKMPFYINFACGIAYAFINNKGTEGRFMWQI
jgi:uncharacterized protein YwqG